MTTRDFIDAAAGDATLRDQLDRLEAALQTRNVQARGQRFLSSQFPTSARSPFRMVRLLYSLAAHGVVRYTGRVPLGLEPVNDVTQLASDLKPWALLAVSAAGLRLTALGERLMRAFGDVDVVANPSQALQSDATIRFIRIMDSISPDEFPIAWIETMDQADRMIRFANGAWPELPLGPYQIVLLDFLSCDTVAARTAQGSIPFPLTEWRAAWTARTAAAADWELVGRELCLRHGSVPGSSNPGWPRLLSRYFAADQRGGGAVQLTVDIFRYLCQGAAMRPALVPRPQAPLDDTIAGQPVVTRDVTVRVRDRDEPARLKDEVGRRCQFCGGGIERTDGTRYVEAAHIEDFSRLDVDGIPGNYLILCPNHHKIFDLGDVAVELPPGPAATELTVSFRDADGMERRYTVRPVPRQVAHGFWDRIRARFR